MTQETGFVAGLDQVSPGLYHRLTFEYYYWVEILIGLTLILLTTKISSNRYKLSSLCFAALSLMLAFRTTIPVLAELGWERPMEWMWYPKYDISYNDQLEYHGWIHLLPWIFLVLILAPAISLWQKISPSISLMIAFTCLIFFPALAWVFKKYEQLRIGSYGGIRTFTSHPILMFLLWLRIHASRKLAPKPE